MSQFAELCECSKPDSQRRCRIACGLPRYPHQPRILNVFDYDGRIPEETWERIQAIIKRHKDKEE